MFELVPSQFMRQFYKEAGFEFTDFQKATLIWNAPEKTRQERLDALKELADMTADAITEKQILERIQFEERVVAAFINNSSAKYVYVVEDREDGCSCGFFADYNRAMLYALKYAKEYETECFIQKQLIVKTPADEIVRNPLRGNPNMDIEFDEYSKYSGHAVAEVTFNENGEIRTLWSYELSKAEEAIVDEYRTDRFESAFMKIPFHLQIGTLVQNVVSGKYGILAQGKEEWDKYLQRIEKQNLYVDFSDVQVIVYELTESGCWSHEHVNPMYLDTEVPPCTPNDKKQKVFRKAAEALGDYLSHKSRGEQCCPDLVLKYAREYAKICHKKEHWEQVLKDAKEPEDIMC